MDLRRIAAIEVPITDYSSLEDKMNHALELTRLAADDNTDLICLPELVNRYKANTPETRYDIKSDCRDIPA